MLLTKFLALFSILIARTCVAEIEIKTREPNYSAYYVEATVEILTSCYANRRLAIGVVGNLPENLIETLWSRKRIPIILFSYSTELVKKFSYFDHHLDRYTLQDFVIVASSFDEIARNIISIRNSKYWNHMSSFLILHWSPRSNDECNHCFDLLFASCQFGALNAKVICHHSTKGTIIIGYNPFTNQAPKPWESIGTMPGLRNHPFSAFIRRYEKGPSICENLDFDKTKDLGGYYIVYLHTYVQGDMVIEGDLELGYHLDLLTRTLNLTAVLITRSYDHLPLPTDRYAALSGGIADVCIDLSELFFGCPMIYPINRQKIYIMTQYRGHKTQLQKILSVIDVPSQIGLYVVLLSTLIFFKCVVRQAFVPSILNVVRIICSTGFINIPRNSPIRFFLAGILMFAVTMHGIYQGQLASLLTKHVPLPDVNSMKDLANSDHTIYGIATFAPLFDDPKFDGRFVPLKSMNCLYYVMRDSLAACVNVETVLVYQARKFKLHLSVEHIQTMEYSWMVRHDWALKQKFDKAVLSMFESDLKEVFNWRFDTESAADFVFDEDVKNNAVRRVMTLADLRFAFVILGIGLTCASITFIAEIAIARYRSRDRTVPVQFLTRRS